MTDALYQRHFDPLTGEELDKAVPAATLVVFRDGDSPPPQLLMVERSSKMAFAGGAAVFPGGRVDPDDFDLAARYGRGLDPIEGASRVAAIRETLEETGLAVGIHAMGNSGGQIVPENIAVARANMHAGRLLSHLCDEHGWALDLEALIPFARWRPPFKIERTFDTRFYIARDESKGQHIAVDKTENTHLFWASASEVIDRAGRGELKIIFPTHRNLERLAQFDHFEQAKAHVAQFPMRTIIPFIVEDAGKKYLCVPDGAGYPVTRELLSSANRG